MQIFAISDLHLCHSVPEKTMEVFGPQWKNYMKRIEEHWKDTILSEDLVLIPGDISWALKFEDALKDLQWIDQLPGRKIIIKGNHDYWWGSYSKLQAHLPPTIQAIQNNAITIEGVTIGGTRLWDSKEYSFDSYIDFQENSNLYHRPSFNDLEKDLNEKIFLRELSRLKSSLSFLRESAILKIAMTHYPPIGTDLAPSLTSKILEEHDIDICVFGHLHSLKPGSKLFGKARDIEYILASSDVLQFTPIKIA